MSDTTFWLTLACIGIGTFLERGSFILTEGKFTLPPKFKAMLRFIPASVLSAIVVPALVLPQGSVEILYGKERLAAALVAVVVAFYTKNIFYTILTGMTALYGIMYLVG